MLPVAACCGIALGASLGLLIRRDRPYQLASLALFSLALAAAFLISGAPLPALGALLLGVGAEVVLAAPSARTRVGSVEGGERRRSRLGSIALSALAALAVLGLLLAVGLESQGQLALGGYRSPSLAQVGHQLVMGTGVAVLALLVLAGATVVGGAALLHRDSREAQEEQAEQTRRRRQEAQRRRQEQREAARAAARAARRGAR